MAEKLAIAVIGAGTMAGRHMRTLKQSLNSRLVAVMDVDAQRAKAVGEEHGVKAYNDLDSVLGDPDVEAVVIYVPHCFHAEISIAAATAGKHVLVATPMALTLADCDRMIKASDAAGKVLMVGQDLRHVPMHRKAKSLIAEGAIGRVDHLMSRRYSYWDPTVSGHPWYLDPKMVGNCVLFALGSLEYDILHWYMDSPVKQIYSKGTESTEIYRGQEDSYSSMMTHDNGAVSVLCQTVVCKGGPNDQHIVGSEGYIVVSEGQVRVNGENVVVEGSEDSKLNQAGEFATCCLEGKEPDASGRSSRHTIAIIEAAMRSAERNEPVLLSEFDLVP